MIRRPVSGPEERLTVMVADVDLSDADKAALRVGRFYDRHPAYAPSGRPDPAEAVVLPEVEAAALVESWTRDATLIGVVTSFDDLTLDTMLRRCRLLPRWHYRTQDLTAVAVGWLAARGHTADDAGRPPCEWETEALSRACGVEPPAGALRHTAMGDTVWAARWWDAITGDGPGRDASWDCDDEPDLSGIGTH